MKLLFYFPDYCRVQFSGIYRNHIYIMRVNFLHSLDFRFFNTYILLKFRIKLKYKQIKYIE